MQVGGKLHTNSVSLVHVRFIEDGLVFRLMNRFRRYSRRRTSRLHRPEAPQKAAWLVKSHPDSVFYVGRKFALEPILTAVDLYRSGAL